MSDPSLRVTSGAFGSDTPAALGRGAVDERGRVLPHALMPMWNDLAPWYAESRKRILFTNDVTMGKRRGPVPRKQRRNRDVFAPLIPNQILGAMHNQNVIARRDPRLKRYTSGTSIPAQERATRVEQWIDPMARKLISWDEMSGTLQNEAEIAASVLPSEVAPQRTPPPFRVNDDDEDSPVLPEWWRDDDDNGIEAYPGRERELREKRNHTKTARAYEAALQDWRIEHPDITVDLIHATDCLPVGLRIQGDGPYIEGLIKRERFSRNALIQRQMAWGKGVKLESMTRNSPMDVELLTGLLTDDEGLPYLVYSVNGFATWWDGGSEKDWAYIDLAKDYGMTRGLWWYEYGWHRTVREADMRGLPWGYAFASGWLSLQTMLGAAIANFYERGYGARGIVPNENAPREAYMDGSDPRKVPWEPGGDLPVLPGQVVDLLPQVISPDCWKIYDILSGGIMEEGPTPGAYGGAGPESGRERTVIRRHIEDSQSHILDGSLRLYRKISMGILELGCKMIEKGLCKPMPVPTRIPIASDGQGNKRRGLIITLDPKDVAGNYDLEAYFQPQPGDNLALAEQAKGLVQAGLRPRRWFHETIMGDDAPEQTEAEIVSDALINDPQGMMEIRDLANRIRNADQEKERKQLQQGGRLSPSGAPLSMAGGLAPPQVEPAPGAPMLPAAGGPGPVGTQIAPPGAAILGGEVAAGMELPSLLTEARTLSDMGASAPMAR